MRNLAITATMFVTALINVAVADTETLQNDGFVSGAPVSFQAGFIAGEIAAARFVPQIACPCVVTDVTLLFGGSELTREMGVLVWEDLAGSTMPGGLLFSGTVSLTGSSVALQLIDLTLTPIVVTGPFRVGLEFGHDGLPSVATDEDGSIDAAANFILADIGGLGFWFRASDLGVSGDFIIRVTIDNLIDPDTDQDGVADSADNCLLVANPDQRDTNGDGIGNACDADLDNDCFVNFGDLDLMAGVFFSANPDADFDGNGVVNFVDLTVMADGFFSPPGPSAPPNDCDFP